MRIEIVNSGSTIQGDEGDNLYFVLAKSGLMEAACGGHGRCGKCRLRYCSDPPEPLPDEKEFLSAAELKDGWRLACLHVLTPSIHEPSVLESSLRIELPACGSVVMVSGFWGDVDAPPMDTLDALKGYGLAIDIGTTTLAVSLLDMEKAAVLASSTRLNSQNFAGQDVISRIAFAASTANSISTLQNAVISDIKTLISDVCRMAGISGNQIVSATAAGNPAMTHLLAGVDVSPLGVAPYTLVNDGAMRLSAQQLGLPLSDGTSVYTLPPVAAFLGGDIVGGMLVLGFDQPGATRLLIDIGTNGEIALVSGNTIYACSTAAGSALEGMNISCGMRAATGAIDKLCIEDGHVRFTTIDSAPPRGLAGSGLLAAVSALCSCGLLSSKGRLELNGPICKLNGQRCLIIDESADIVLTQKDIRQVQLIKGAVFSGVTALLEFAGCPPEAVEQVYVAGGFGNSLSEYSLLECGILPRQFTGKISFIGNSSLAGARFCLLSAETRKRAERLAAGVKYIELAELEDYQQRFLSAMLFYCENS